MLRNEVTLCGFVVVSLLTTNVASTCTSTGPGCITASAASCRNLPDGDYQACEDCTVYHSCSGGVNWPNRPCPATEYLGLRGKLVWKQVSRGNGFCDYTSNTCTECSNGGGVSGRGGGDNGGGCTSTGAGCITASTSCRTLRDGDYQACEGCTFYHSCAGGINRPNRPCGNANFGGLNGKLIWQKTGANTGFCDYSSSTCKECVSNGGGNNNNPSSTANGGGVCTSTGSRCITASPSSCTGRPDGNYQACEGCTFFHTCVAGYLNYAYRDCAATNQGGINGKLVWDDNLKRCEYQSTTCRQCI